MRSLRFAVAGLCAVAGMVVPAIPAGNAAVSRAVVVPREDRFAPFAITVHVGDAVESIGCAESNRTGHRHNIVPLETPVACRSLLNGCTGKRDQVLYIPAIQRKFDNSCVLDDLPHADVARFDLRRVRLNFDRLGDLANIHDRIDDGVTVDLQHDPGLRVCAESRQRRFQPVRPQCQIR